MKLSFLPLAIAIQMSIATAITTSLLDDSDSVPEDIETLHECRERVQTAFDEVVQACLFDDDILECFEGHRADYEEDLEGCESVKKGLDRKWVECQGEVDVKLYQKYKMCLPLDIEERNNCLHEIDDFLEANEDIFLTQCTCSGAAEAEKEEST